MKRKEVGNVTMDASSADEKILIALRQINRAIDVYSKKISKQFGLTSPQLIVLKAIHELQNPSLKSIAKSVALSSATVSTILDRLIAKKLVSRTRRGEDKRQSELTLTSEGEEVLKTAPTVLQDTFTRKFNKLDEWEKSLLLSSIQRIAAMMDVEEVSPQEENDSLTLFVPPPTETNM